MADLYTSPTSPEVDRDLATAAKRAAKFKADYQGKVVALGGDGAKLMHAIKEYEELSDLLGKLGSYAGLLYAANQTDPERVKFYGNISEKLTDISSDLIFFDLELNQIENDDLAKALKNKDLKRYKPGSKRCARKSPTSSKKRSRRCSTKRARRGVSALDRLFDETMTGLRFEVAGETGELTLEPTLNLLSDPEEPKRRAAAEALASVFKDNIRLFTLITNTLAKDKEISDRWRGFKDVAEGRHLSNRVEGPVVDALVDAVRDAYPAPVAPLLRA